LIILWVVSVHVNTAVKKDQKKFIFFGGENRQGGFAREQAWLEPTSPAPREDATALMEMR
jgi:hypothetical protein